jgi:hypothetical protein
MHLDALNSHQMMNQSSRMSEREMAILTRIYSQKKWLREWVRAGHMTQIGNPFEKSRWASHCLRSRGNQTRRSVRSDTLAPASGRRSSSTCHLGLTSTERSQWLAQSRQRSSDDRTRYYTEQTWPPSVRSCACPCHQALTGRAAPLTWHRARAASDHFQRGSRARFVRPDVFARVQPDAQASGPSRPHPMRYVSLHRTHPLHIRWLLHASVRLKTDTAPSVPWWPDSQGQRSVTTQLESGRSKTPSFDLQLCHPWLNVLITKCFILCTCVSIFSQTLSRVLALTRI